MATNNHLDTLLAALEVSEEKKREATRQVYSEAVAQQRERLAKSRVQMKKDVAQSRAAKQAASEAKAVKKP